MAERKISILHLASDEKFINNADYIFEKAFPGCNHFMIVHPRFNRKLTYVKLKDNFEPVPKGNKLIETLAERTGHYDCIFLHGITDLNSTVFLSSKDKQKFIGVFWGAELYTEKNFPGNSLKGELTASIKLPEPDYSLKERFKDIIRKIIYHKKLALENATNIAAPRLSYIASLTEEGLQPFMEHKLISEDIRHIPFTYYPLEYITKGNESSVVNGNDILLGNSAFYTNNHLEALHLLHHIDIGSRKIIMPLSYGNTIYADYIEAKGFELFSGNFIPLRNFMPLSEYTRILQSCGIVIMNHYRSQGVGNILAALWLGSKVYLNESNAFLHYLRRIGAKVFSIEKDLTEKNKSALVNLSGDEIEHNRRILKNTIAEEKIIEKLKRSVYQYFS
jgi:dTDP-N-acetylfucosamine:lipid II N-acetylfucosaminyltransferase